MNSQTLRDVRSEIPYLPGLYEWGTMAPGSHNIIAFYLGKAGVWGGVCRVNRCSSQYDNIAWHLVVLVGQHELPVWCFSMCVYT